MHHTPEMDQLFKAILSLRSMEECYMFFEDICTVQELVEMSRRLEVANRLYRGEKYGDVSKDTGVSSATISRVNRCLQYGSGGYRLAIDRKAAVAEEKEESGNS